MDRQVSLPPATRDAVQAISRSCTECQLPMALVGLFVTLTGWPGGVDRRGGQEGWTGDIRPQGDHRLLCQSRSTSGVVSGVNLKVRSSQSIFMPTWPWVSCMGAAETQVSP